mmetsp:Transcript_15840/g.22654  ORF Transcript_15840/g.22654 Transcript_15840/m.22654 type:complete len:92 (-) Transcript_15840:345-620(-)
MSFSKSTIMTTLTTASSISFPSTADAANIRLSSPKTMTVRFEESKDGLFLVGNCKAISDVYRQCVLTGDVEQSSLCRAAVQSYLQCSRSDK